MSSVRCATLVRTEGDECGEVTAINQTVAGIGHVAIVTGICSIPGDSGGPVYYATTAYGILSGGPLPQPTPCWTSFQGIRGAENLMNVDVKFS